MSYVQSTIGKDEKIIYNIEEQEMLEKMNLKGGIRFKEIGPGKWKNAGIKPGFIVTMVDKREIKNVGEFNTYLSAVQGDGILISGFYPNGEKAYYGIAW